MFLRWSKLFPGARCRLEAIVEESSVLSPEKKMVALDIEPDVITTEHQEQKEWTKTYNMTLKQSIDAFTMPGICNIIIGSSAPRKPHTLRSGLKRISK